MRAGILATEDDVLEEVGISAEAEEEVEELVVVEAGLKVDSKKDQLLHLVIVIQQV